MRRLKFMPLMAVVGAMCLFTACSDDDDYVQMPGDGLEAKTYTMADGLTVTLNGDVAYGQTVTFTPGQNGNATITIKGSDLNVGELIGGMMSKADNPTGFSIPTASMIPGSVQVEIPVQLTLDNEGVNTFSGNATTDYCTFNYAGKVTPESLTMAVTDLKLKNTSLAGKYDMPEFDDTYFNISRLEWESENSVKVELFPGFPMDFPVKTMLVMTFAGYELVNVDGESMTVFDALTTVLKSVTLGEDGSVTAVYADTKVPGLPEKTAPKGLAQYVVTSDNQIRLYLNPSAIIASSASKAGEGDASSSDLTNLLPKLLPVVENVLPKVTPLFSQGIPVCYGPALIDEEADNVMVPTTDPNFVSFYLDNNLLLPILKDVSPLLKDKEVIDFIVGAASSDPTMGEMAVMLPGILGSIPDVIDTTSKIELGLNFVKQ